MRGNVPVRFGKGPMEKGQQWYLASGLLHGQSRIIPKFTLISQVHPHIALRQDGMCSASGFFGNSWDWVWMHGQGFPPGFLNARLFSVSHISLRFCSSNSPTVSGAGQTHGIPTFTKTSVFFIRG